MSTRRPDNKTDPSISCNGSARHLPHRLTAVHDLGATIKGWRTAARTLALGSLVLVAALSWEPVALLIDTMMHWPNIAMGLSQVALVAGVAGGCVVITTVVSGPRPALSRRLVVAQYGLAAVVAAVSLVMFFVAGQQYEMAPREYLEQNIASSWLLPLLLYVPLALTLVSWAGYSSR